MNKNYLRGYYQGYLSKEAGGELNELKKLDYSKDVLPMTYGDQTQTEIAKADLFNEGAGIPWRMSTYNEPVTVAEYDDLKKEYEYAKKHNMDADFIKVLKDRAERAVGYSPALRRLFLNKGKATNKYFPPPETDKRSPMYMMQKEKGRDMGFKDYESMVDYVYSEGGEEERKAHEGAHYATVTDEEARRALNEFFKKRGWYDKQALFGAYPMRNPTEIIPPLTALQRYMYKTKGKRIEKSSQYDEYIKPFDAIKDDNQFEEAIKDLPMELQRFHRYRRYQGRAFRNKYDKINKRIVPGIVRTQRAGSEGGRVAYG
jgi:hypothetical protein